MSEPIPISPLSEDVTRKMVGLLEAFGDRYYLRPGFDDDGWYLAITDRPSVPAGRVVIARSIAEARAWLERLDEGLP